MTCWLETLLTDLKRSMLSCAQPCVKCSEQSYLHRHVRVTSRLALFNHSSEEVLGGLRPAIFTEEVTASVSPQARASDELAGSLDPAFKEVHVRREWGVQESEES